MISRVKCYYDMLIAASAMAEGAVLVSHNIRHFSKIKGLCLEDWF